MAKRFSVQIYNASNRLECTFSGYDTRETAERIANAKRREIENRGWNMRVYVHEGREVSYNHDYRSETTLMRKTPANVQEITEIREKFSLNLTRWAAKNGYKRRHGVWQKGDHYLCPQSEIEGNWFVTKRSYGSGALIERFVI